MSSMHSLTCSLDNLLLFSHMGSLGHYSEFLAGGLAGRPPDNVSSNLLEHLRSQPLRIISGDYPEFTTCLKGAIKWYNCELINKCNTRVWLGYAMVKYTQMWMSLGAAGKEVVDVCEEKTILLPNKKKGTNCGSVEQLIHCGGFQRWDRWWCSSGGVEVKILSKFRLVWGRLNLVLVTKEIYSCLPVA